MKTVIKLPQDFNSRFGRFFVPRDWLKKPELAISIFDGMVIVEANYRHDRQAYEYLALSEHFSPVEPCNTSPTYRIVIGNNGQIIWEISQ